jgi:AcrR family transcriptional regulator
LNTRSSSRILQKRDRKKLEILRSAAAAFRDRGFDGTSMEQIAGALQMTKGSLYYYFKNKQEIMYFTQEYSLDRMLQVAGRISERSERADVKVQLMIRAQLVLMLDELQASSAHIEFHALPRDLLQKIISRRDQYEAKLRSMVEEGMRKTVFEKSDAKTAVLAILGAINWTVKWFKPGGPLPVEDLAERFGRFLVRALMARGKEPGEVAPELVREVLR